MKNTGQFLLRKPLAVKHKRISAGGVAGLSIFLSIIGIGAGIGIGYALFKKSKFTEDCYCPPIVDSDDTGSTGTDTGSTGTDTGSTGTDTGSIGTDTGSTGTDTGSTQNQMQFKGFRLSADDNVKPWCIGTKYAYQYEVNGVKSSPSPYSDRIKSYNESNPSFQVTVIPDAKTIILRKIDGEAEETPGTVLETTLDADGVFIDDQNPCKQDFAIAAPTEAIKNEGGAYEDANNFSFQKEASAGTHSWCISTDYKFSYDKNGVLSSQGPVSDPVKSYEGVNPVFKVPMKEGYGVKVFRKASGDKDYLPILATVSETGEFVDSDNPCTNFIVGPQSAPIFQQFDYKFES